MVTNSTGAYLLAHAEVEHNDAGFGSELAVCDICKKNPWFYTSTSFGVEFHWCHKCGEDV